MFLLRGRHVQELTTNTLGAEGHGLTTGKVDNIPRLSPRSLAGLHVSAFHLAQCAFWTLILSLCIASNDKTTMLDGHGADTQRRKLCKRTLARLHLSNAHNTISQGYVSYQTLIAKEKTSRVFGECASGCGGDKRVYDECSLFSYCS